MSVLAHVAGRVPVIVTTTHFGTTSAPRARSARRGGGARHGDDHAALSRRDHPRAGSRDLRILPAVSDAISIPIMIQDAPVAGTPLSAPFWRGMAKEIANVAYFKIEVPFTPPPSCAN
jgi:2-keto-3-deoxy-L-arabinonate dehydratase